MITLYITTNITIIMYMTIYNKLFFFFYRFQNCTFSCNFFISPRSFCTSSLDSKKKAKNGRCDFYIKRCFELPCKAHMNNLLVSIWKLARMKCFLVRLAVRAKQSRSHSLEARWIPLLKLHFLFSWKVKILFVISGKMSSFTLFILVTRSCKFFICIVAD